jgi:hypothetical protein
MDKISYWDQCQKLSNFILVRVGQIWHRLSAKVGTNFSDERNKATELYIGKTRIWYGIISFMKKIIQHIKIHFYFFFYWTNYRPFTAHRFNGVFCRRWLNVYLIKRKENNVYMPGKAKYNQWDRSYWGITSNTALFFILNLSYAIDINYYGLKNYTKQIKAKMLTEIRLLKGLVHSGLFCI